MREIKFRAWDVSRRVMIRFEDIESLAFRHNALDQRTIDHIVYVTVYADSNGEPEPGLERARGDDLILNQFTGLKDKKGREIYERDILLHPFGIAELENDQRVVVEWDTATASFGTRHPKGGRPWYLQTGADVEILGTLYENPELLI